MKHAFLKTAAAVLVALGSHAAAQDLKMSHVRPQDATIDVELRTFSAAGAEGYYASFRDVTKTYIPANTHFEVWYMIISNESLAGLSEEDRAALIEQAAAFEATRWEVAEADQARNEQRLVDELGATVVDLSDEEYAAMAAKVRADVWPVVRPSRGSLARRPHDHLPLQRGHGRRHPRLCKAGMHRSEPGQGVRAGRDGTMPGPVLLADGDGLAGRGQRADARRHGATTAYARR